jgi:transposase-like protein
MDIISPPPVKEEKKRIGRTPRYTDQYYMLMAKEVVDEGMSFRTAADKYNCSHGTVSHWCKLYREGKLVERVEKQKSSQSSAATQFQRQERYIRELKAQIGELYLEKGRH